MIFEDYLKEIKQYKFATFPLLGGFNSFEKDQKKELLTAITANKNIEHLNLDAIALAEEDLQFLVSLLKGNETIECISFREQNHKEAFLKGIMELLLKGENTKLTYMLQPYYRATEFSRKIDKRLKFNRVYRIIKYGEEREKERVKGMGEKIKAQHTEIEVYKIYGPLYEIDEDVNVFEDMKFLIKAIPEDTEIKRLILPDPPLLREEEFNELETMLQEDELNVCITTREKDRIQALLEQKEKKNNKRSTRKRKLSTPNIKLSTRNIRLSLASMRSHLPKRKLSIPGRKSSAGKGSTGKSSLKDLSSSTIADTENPNGGLTTPVQRKYQKNIKQRKLSLAKTKSSSGKGSTGKSSGRDASCSTIPDIINIGNSARSMKELPPPIKGEYRKDVKKGKKI